MLNSYNSTSVNVSVHNDKTPEYAALYQKIRKEVLDDILASGKSKLFDKEFSYIIEKSEFTRKIHIRFRELQLCVEIEESEARTPEGFMSAFIDGLSKEFARRLVHKEADKLMGLFRI